MGNLVINKHLFLLNATASSVTSWYPVDYRFSEIQERSIQGVKAATGGDILNVELKTEVTAADNTVATVITTATAFPAAATNFSCVIRGPFEYIRIRKEGSSAAATVIGIV